MNIATTPHCISCSFHRRCEACRIEWFKPGGRSDLAPPIPMGAPSPEIYSGNETESRMKTTKHASDMSKPTSDFNSDIENDDWRSYSMTAVITPGRLDLLQDLSLAEPKRLKRNVPDAQMPDKNDKSNALTALCGNQSCSEQDNEEQPSSCDPTPTSEPWEYWEESRELSSFNLEGDSLLEVFKGPLHDLFQEWVGGICCNGGGRDKGCSPPSPSAPRSNGHQNPESKRKRVDKADIENTDARPRKLRITEKRSRKLMPLDKSLACPYLKKDYRRHWDCRGFGFTKVSYMKAHLYRKHAIPIYCPICQQSFENVQLRDSHSRERNCEPIENVEAPDGITSEQRDWLHQRGPRNFSEEEQWYRIFEFLFPGHPRPPSPYNDSAFSEDLLDFRDFINGPTAQEILLQRVRENPNWTPGLEAIFRPDLVHGLEQLYWRWAGTEHGGTGQASTIATPSREAVAASTQSTNEETTSFDPQSETRLGETSDSSTAGPTTQETSEGATSATVQELPDDVEPQLDSVEARPFADYELEERKVDEDDQPPPHELHTGGIALVPEPSEWPNADFPDLDYADYDPLDFTTGIEGGLSAADHAFWNPLDDIEGAEDWIPNFDLLGYGASLPIEGPEPSPGVGSTVDLGLTVAGEESGTREGERTESGESDDFVIITKPST